MERSGSDPIDWKQDPGRTVTVVARWGVKQLRTGRNLRKTHKNTDDRRGRIKDMVPIGARPPTTEDRAVPGSWEGDLVRHEALFDQVEVGTTLGSQTVSFSQRRRVWVGASSVDGHTATRAATGLACD